MMRELRFEGCKAACNRRTIPILEDPDMIQMIDPATQTVLVTGATSGFGAAVCHRFHKAGAKVIGTGRRQGRLATLQGELGERCHTVRLDVTDREAVFEVLEALPALFDRPNVCIVNAGLALGLQPAHESDIADWEQMIATNVNGAVAT